MDIYTLQWYKNSAKHFTNIISLSPHNDQVKEILQSFKGKETDVTISQWLVGTLPSYLILSPILSAFKQLLCFPKNKT